MIIDTITPFFILSSNAPSPNNKPKACANNNNNKKNTYQHRPHTRGTKERAAQAPALQPRALKSERITKYKSMLILLTYLFFLVVMLHHQKIHTKHAQIKKNLPT
jgi:hypothetical protein